jgi:hypothetical protein
MTATWVSGLGTASTTRPAITATVAVILVFAMLPAIPATAWRTTATAAASSPLIQPCPPSMAEVDMIRPNAVRIAAEGRVNITQAANIPAQPARW